MRRVGPFLIAVTAAAALLLGVTAPLVAADPGATVDPGVSTTAGPGAPDSNSRSGPGFHERQGRGGEIDVNVCSDEVPAGTAHCNARIRTDGPARLVLPAPRGERTAASLGNGGAYDPAYLQSAYNAPSATAGAGQTIAIVDAFDDPSAEADLGVYRSFFGLSACTTANGCFRKVDQNGGTAYPVANAGWAEEISLDVDMAGALCNNCHILLVEAKTNSLVNLGLAVNTAVALGANVVSNSYGSGEYSTETQDAVTYYDHPGVAITVSSGDSGYGVEFPAASPFVTAVGGTSLQQATNTGVRNATETAWAGAGSGCSAFEPKQSWQTDSGCSKRSVADVSAVADPATGVWVYDTYGGDPGFEIFGGTSVAAPIVGALYALAGNSPGASTLPTSYPYANRGALNDVTSGSNGTCGGSYLCTAGAGYDGPAGLGTGNGIAAFSAAVIPPPLPSAPQTLTATAGNAQVTLAWTAPASPEGSVTYDVYRATSPGGEGSTPIATGLTTTGFTNSGLSNGTKYYYEVTAVNAAGQGPASNEASATPISTPAVPSAPQTLTATAGNARVVLAWTAPASPGGSVTYDVYRATSPGGEGSTPVKRLLSTTGFTDIGLSNGKTYYYKVTAVNSIGQGPASNETSATPATIPGAPQGPRAVTSTTQGVVLTWHPGVTGGSAITGYLVYRSTTSGAEVVYAAASCTTTTCTFNDTGTTAAVTYYYKVAATNAVGTGLLSGQVSAKAR